MPDRVLAKYRVPSLLKLKISEQSKERTIGSYKGFPVRNETERTVSLLSIGLRMPALIEHQVRQQLAETNEALAGLNTGNPKRTTEGATAEAMLQAFKGIHLPVVFDWGAGLVSCRAALGASDEDPILGRLSIRYLHPVDAQISKTSR